MVVPVNRRKTRKQSQPGMGYNSQLGYRRDEEKSDLPYLKTLGDVNEVGTGDVRPGLPKPGESEGKFLLLLTSTPKDIDLSNHGAVFTDCGRIELDLAKVKSEDFVFHYGGEGAATMESGIPLAKQTSQPNVAKELQRARESVIRNREIILKQYPATAVKWTHKPVVDPEAIKSRATEDAEAGRWPDFIPPGHENNYDLGLRARHRAEGQAGGQGTTPRAAARSAKKSPQVPGAIQRRVTTMLTGPPVARTTVSEIRRRGGARRTRDEA